MGPAVVVLLALAFAFCRITVATGFVSPARALTTTTTTMTTKLRGGYDATVGTDPSTPIQFFTLPGNTCPYAQRTHIALLELNLPFDMTEVIGFPTKPDWYLKINPRGKVPALRVPTPITTENNDDTYDDNNNMNMAVIYESSICNEFLCDYASTTLVQLHHTLMPTADPIMKANIRLHNDHCDNILTKTQFTYLMNKDATMDDELCTQMENALLYYENVLKQSKGPYLMGENFTLADIHVFPFIQRLVITHKHWKNYELTNDKFPLLLQWHKSCLERESVSVSSMTSDKTIEVYGRFFSANYSFGGLNKSK